MIRSGATASKSGQCFEQIHEKMIITYLEEDYRAKYPVLDEYFPHYTGASACTFYSAPIQPNLHELQAILLHVSLPTREKIFDEP